jgi:TonB family protein
MLRIARYVCLNAVLAAAVASAATIGGVVYDPAGAVIPKAVTTLAGVGSGFSQTVAADEVGRFTFPAVEPGRYRLEVRSPGFAAFDRGGLDVEDGSNVTLPVFLRLGTVTESLEVSSQAPGGARPAGAASMRIRVGGNVEQPKLVHMERIPYPEAVKARGVQGIVVVRGAIQEDGTLAGLTAGADADPALAEATIAALRAWRYQPARLDGQPIAAETIISIHYKLQ